MKLKFLIAGLWATRAILALVGFCVLPIGWLNGALSSAYWRNLPDKPPGRKPNGV